VADAGRPPRVEVTAAVIERDGAFLLTRRLDGTHLEGCWEFPGGKRHEGESLRECLAREIREELDAEIEVGDLILATSHDYRERIVALHFFRCSLLTAPRPVLGQEMRWVSRADLRSYPLPPADDQLVEVLMRAGPDPGKLRGVL
jgi:8-oxo-dGTP diphosphatase